MGRKTGCSLILQGGAAANALHCNIVEMAKAYVLNLYKYLKYLMEHRPNKDMSEDELIGLAPWNELVQKNVETRMRKMLAFRGPSDRISVMFWFALKLNAYILFINEDSGTW